MKKKLKFNIKMVVFKNLGTKQIPNSKFRDKKSNILKTKD